MNESDCNSALAQSATAIAIVGMSCIFPGAPSAPQFWENIVNGIDSTREPGEEEWNANYFRNKPKSTFGNIYCTRGGFITEYADFDPLEFGIMPSSVRGADPDQFLVLRVAAEALADAGYHHKTFDGERAEVIIGRTMAPGVGSLNLIQHGQTVDQVIEIIKSVSPDLEIEELERIAALLKEGLQPCNADTIPAVMPNVMAGRVACKLGFRGRNLVLDAACASSLIAVETAMQSLISRQSDLAIAGGVHVSSSAGFSQMFCGVGALSQSGIIRPFDDAADGTLLGEGVGMLVLKRLADAEQHGNRIYAIIRGVGTSSDGRTGGLLSPSVEGEMLAMHRAYEMAGVSPRTVELLEAHGTATGAGDIAEMKAVHNVFSEDTTDESQTQPGVQEPWCAIGSVKSMIGHTQAASGVAGLIKTALALHHKILPPTLNVSKANSRVNWKDSPCYIISKAKPWQSNNSEERSSPRRAAVSAFGFGGVNAHVVLEEYVPSSNAAPEKLKPVVISSAGRRPSVRLSLKFPYLSARALKGVQLRSRRSSPLKVPALRCDLSEQGPESNGQGMILSSFVQSMTLAHHNMLRTQESVMLAYLKEDS